MRGFSYLSGETDGVDLGSMTKEAKGLKDQIWRWLTNEEMWMNVLSSGIRHYHFILTRLVIRVVYKMIDQFILRQEKSRIQVNSRRFVTVGVAKNVTSVCATFMILIILSEFNFELGPLLAGAVLWPCNRFRCTEFSEGCYYRILHYIRGSVCSRRRNQEW